MERILTLLQQIPDGLRSVWFWGALPAYFLLYLLIGLITIRFSARKMTKELRQLRRHSAMEILNACLRQFSVIVTAVTLLGIILPYYLLLNLKHENVLTAIAGSSDALTSMAIGLTTLVLTVSVVIILFRKDYYLVFSITDVLKSYHFTGCLSLLLISCVGTCTCEFMQLYLQEGSLWWKLVFLTMEWCVLISLVTCGISLCIICLVMFSTNKVELRLLDRLYRIFRGGDRPNESQSDSAANWEGGAVRTNLDYLCAEFVSAARLLPIHRVIRFEYLTGEARRKTRADQRGHFLVLYVAAALGVWCISMVIVWVVLGQEGSGLFLLDTILLAVMILPALIGFGREDDGPAQLLFEDTVGYEMEMETSKKRKLVRIPRITLRSATRYDRFVQSMNSLTAFFVIALDRGMRQEMTESALALVLDWLDDVKEKHSCLYLPVFAAGFYAFAHGQKLSAVRLCYAKVTGKDETGDMTEADPSVSPEPGDRPSGPSVRVTIPGTGPEKITGGQPADFDAMLLGHIGDLTREVPPAGRDADAVMADYMNWLHDAVRAAVTSVR